MRNIILWIVYLAAALTLIKWKNMEKTDMPSSVKDEKILRDYLAIDRMNMNCNW